MAAVVTDAETDDSDESDVTTESEDVLDADAEIVLSPLTVEGRVESGKSERPAVDDSKGEEEIDCSTEVLDCGVIIEVTVIIDDSEERVETVDNNVVEEDMDKPADIEDNGCEGVDEWLAELVLQAESL